MLTADELRVFFGYIIKFLSHEFIFCGFKFSFFNVWAFSWAFYMIINGIERIFGKYEGV